MKDEKDEFIECELLLLWDSLWEALERSLSGDPERPSMEMENIMDRIIWATSLVGPISWKEINLAAVKTGRYEYWAKHMGIEYNLPTEDEFLAMTSKLEKVGWDENL